MRRRQEPMKEEWGCPDPGGVAVTVVAALGAVGLIVAQRPIWPAIVQDSIAWSISRLAPRPE